MHDAQSSRYSAHAYADRTDPALPKIVVLATTFPARPGDGTPEFVLSLARFLQDQYSITIVTPRVPRAPLNETIEGISVKRFRYFPRRWEGLANGAMLHNIKSQPWRIIELPFFLFAFLWTSLITAARARPALVHAHWLIPAGAVALVLKTLLHVPYVVTAHGIDVFAFRGLFFPALKKLVMRQAAVVSPASEEMAFVLGLSEREAQRYVAPMGIDVNSIADEVGDRNPEPGRFLFVGRLVDKKGVDVLLQALSLLDKGSAVIVGDGPERGRLQRLAEELDLVRRVRFRGQLPRETVLQELRRAHILVVPSKVGRGGDADSTPLVMSEAMAANVPVVASRLGGLSEQIRSGKNGLLVNPGDVAALAEALRAVLEGHHDLVGWTKNAAELMKGPLDVRSTARRYDLFYKEAMLPQEHGPSR